MLKRALLSTVLAFPFAAQAADLPSRAAPAPAPAAFSWQGAYIGGTLGFGVLSMDHSHDITEGSKINGVIGGLHGGYNFQNGNFVYGVEADLSAASINGRPSENDWNGSSATTVFHSSMIATLRGRAGLSFDRTLVYGTAGLSYLKGKIASDGEPDNTGVNRFGYVVGAGVEYALNNNLVLRAEGLYNIYTGSVSFSNGNESLKFKNVTLGRVGFSYKF